MKLNHTQHIRDVVDKMWPMDYNLQNKRTIIDIALNSLASSSLSHPSMSSVVYHIQYTIKFELELSNDVGGGIAI